MKIFQLAGAAAGVVLGASVLSAQAVQFKGTTQGCFLSDAFSYPGCNNTSNFGFDQSVVFAGGAFNETAPGNSGGVKIGGDPANPTSNLGYFTLGGLPSSYTGDIFKLAINFEAPSNVSPDAMFQAIMYGSVNSFGNGSVVIGFGGPKQFSFVGPTYSGVFTLKIDEVTLSAASLINPYQTIKGEISTSITGGGVTATPEPATTALLATGLTGLLPFARRRKKAIQA